MKNKALISLLVIFAVVLSTGVVYAVSPFDRGDSSVSEFSGAVESSLPSRFVLEDDSGAKWNLNIAFGVVMYGTVLPPGETKPWPAYGFIFGKEMVLWADGPNTGGWIDGLARTGMWNFETMICDYTWVSYYTGGGDHGSGQLWPAGTQSGKSVENGENPWVKSGTAPTIPEEGVSPLGVPSGEAVNNECAIPLAFDDLTDRGAICLEDSYGYTYDLDIAYGVILHGVMSEGFPTYGFIMGDEMFLWTDAPGTGGYVDSAVYAGVWDFGTMTFSGFWTNYPTGGFDEVQVWPCGAPPETEYYAVISGNGYNCAYADDDAYDMYDVLTSYGNWDPANIKLLVSTASGSKHDCTKTNIQNGIAWMASQADEDDVCVFFYAGHGGYQNDVAPIDESDGYDEYICPEGGNIRDDELDTWMSATSGYKLVAIDSCFSGGFIKVDGLESRCSGLPRVEITDGFAQDFCRQEDLCKVGWNVHTACDEDESAYGSGTLQNGVFTYYFVEGLYGPADSDSDGDVDSLEAHYYTRPKVQAFTGNAQNPWLCYYTSPNPLIWVE